MAEAVILSQDTYMRIMKMLAKWEAGQIVELGQGLKLLETGTGYEKIGIDPNNLVNVAFGTLNLNVCIGGTGQFRTFLTKL